MNVGASHALEQALAYYQAPARLASAAQRPLPEGVIELLRLAAGDAAQASQSAYASGESPQRVAEAAVFFVQQVMFAAGADAHRVLGVNPGAPAVRIREHYRWLIRWLHPDRNADQWDSVYTDRVTRAWQSLRRSGALAEEGGDGDTELRDSVSREVAAAKAPSTVLAAARLARQSRQAEAAPPMISARTARRLPYFVLGGLGLAAVSLVALLWYAQQELASPPIRTVDAPVPAMDVFQVDPSAPEVSAVDDTRMNAPELQGPLQDEALPTAVAPEHPELWVAATTTAPVPTLATAPSLRPSLAPAAESEPASQPESIAVTPAPVARSARLEPAAGPITVTVAKELASPPAASPTSGSTPAKAEPNASLSYITPQQDLPITEDRAYALLTRFTDAYIAGDLPMLMGLLTRDAVSRSGGRDAIADDYQALFSESRERRLTLWTNGWVERAGDVVVLANYEAWVKQDRLLPGTTDRGSIRFTLSREDGELKISQVLHD